MRDFEIRAGIRRLFRLAVPRPRAAAADADDELRSLLHERVDYLVARGLSPEAAREEALRRLGRPLTDARHALHHSAERRERIMTARQWLDEVRLDLRYAVRGARLQPGFTLAVVLILGLGIGANTAMFQVVDRLLLQPPPYLAAPDETHQVYFYRTVQGKEGASQSLQYQRYLDLSRDTESFSVMGAAFFSRVAIGLGDATQQMSLGALSASTFAMFTARPVLGRFFTDAEDAPPTGTEVAVLGYEYWRSRYGADSAVLGTQLQIGSRPFTVIGVAPRGFRALSNHEPAVFVPITAYGYWMLNGTASNQYADGYGIQWLGIYAVRRSGVSVAAATADLSRAVQVSWAAQEDRHPRTTPAAVARPRAVAGPVLPGRGPNETNVSKLARWVAGVSGIVLLIACANVANLLLARTLQRRREVAVRLTLGVSRGRLVRQLLLESLVLAAGGVLVGIALAQWGGAILRTQFLSGYDPTSVIGDGRVLVFTLVTAIGVGLVTGLAPAVQSLRSDVAGALKTGTREGGGRRSRLRSALMVGQAALSMLLLVGAGLFVRSVQKIGATRLGYDPDRVLNVSLSMRGERLDTAAARELRERLVTTAAALPGVVGVSRVMSVPFQISMSGNVVVPGLDTARVNAEGPFNLQAGSPGYFETMGTRILQGRGFDARDRSGAPLVMVVSEAMADVLWPGQGALGTCVRLNADTAPCREVIGVAENIRAQSLRSSEDWGRSYYLPIEQYRSSGGGLFVRVSGDAMRQRDVVRRALQPLMPGASYVSVTPLDENLARVRRSWWLGATMFTIFGALALVIAAFGLYSVISYTTTQQRHAMGVRLALGAQPGHLVRLVLRQGLGVAVLGVTLGAAVAWWAARWAEPLLFEVSARNPWIYGLTALALIAAALAASLVPALRTTRVDPALALRSD